MPSDYYYLYAECGPLQLLGAALKATNGNSSPTALMQAIDALGTSFVLPGVVGDASSLSTSRHDAPDMVRAFAYQASCSCIAYTTPPVPAP